MARKEVKPFLLRVDPRVLTAIQRWAEEDLRSLNGQIEYLLRRALARRGREAAGRVGRAGRRNDELTNGKTRAR